MKNTHYSTLPALSACYRFNDVDFIVRNLASAPGDTIAPDSLPDPVRTAPGIRPVAIKYSPRLGSRIFMLDGRNLSVADASGTLPLGTLHADFLTVADTGSRLIFMTSLGPWIVDYDPATDRIDVIGERPLYPPISFRAIPRPAQSAGLRAVSFKGAYTHWTGPLDEADALAISGEIGESYDRCVRKITDDGHFVAPVLAWYHLLDAAGRVVYRSSPVLVEPQGDRSPVSCELRVNRDGGVYKSTFNASLSVDAFALQVVLPEPAICDMRDAVRAKIFWSRPLPRTDISAHPAVTFAGTSSEPRLRVAMPDFARYGDMVMALLDRLDEGDCFSCMMNLTEKWVSPGTERPFFLSMPRALSAYDSHITFKQILSRRPSPRAMLRWAAPNAFAAATACVDGDMVVWGDISPLGAIPQGVSAWATAVAASEPWSAVVRVTVASGSGGEPEILSFEESGAANAPVKLSQLISYPDPKATLIEIEITRKSGVTRLSVPLVPSEGNSAACGMMPAGMTLGEPLAAGVEPLLPVMRRAARRHPGLILSASASDPLSPLSALEATSGSIVAVTPASRSSSAWDFARRHLYLFGSGGIHAVAVSSAMSAVSAHLIDSRGVESGSRVAWSPEGVYAVAAGKLLRVSGSRAEVVADDVSAGAIGWCGASGRLYCASGGSSVKVRSPDGSWHQLDLPGNSSYSLLGDGNRLLLHSPGKLIALPADNDAPAAVLWQRRLRLARRGVPLAIRGVEVHLSSPAAEVTVSLLGDNGSRRPSLIASVDVGGEVAAPILLPVIFPCPFIYFTVRIEGTVAPSSSLSAVNLVF